MNSFHPHMFFQMLVMISITISFSIFHCTARYDPFEIKQKTDLPSSQIADSGNINKPEIALDRAMWVRDESDRIIPPGKNQERFYSFSEAPHGDAINSAGRIFLEIRSQEMDEKPDKDGTLYQVPTHFLGDRNNASGSSIAESERQMRKFIKQAKELHGILYVELLDGQDKWAEASNTHIPQEICDAIVAYNRRANCSAHECFDGAHFDIEIHLHPDFRKNGQTPTKDIPNGTDPYSNPLQQGLIDIARYCRKAFDASGQKLSLAFDIGSDYIYYHKDLRDFFLGKGQFKGLITYLTIMNYNDNPQEWVNGWKEKDDEGKTVGDFLFHGLKYNLNALIGPSANDFLFHEMPMRFGLETQSGDLSDWITFAEEGYQRMETARTVGLDTYGPKGKTPHPNFRGTAVDHYSAYRTLQPGEL